MLAAQRDLYSAAKNIIGLQAILSGPVAVCATVLGLVKPEVKASVALWGITVLVFDLTVFTPWQKALREKAARIQELFDCTVLGLPWNDIKVGKKPEPELIHERAVRYCKNGEHLERLTNWYPVTIASVPQELGAVICQRSNIFWDSKLRRRYATGVATIAVLFTLILIWVAFYKNIPMSDLVLFMAAPMASAYVLAYKQATEHLEAADRLDKLKDLSNGIFAEAISANCDAIKSKCRLIQDEIFDGRKRNPPIFDFIFRMFQDQNDAEMNVGAEALIKRANGATKE